MSLCRENSSNDFFICLFLFENKENNNIHRKIIKGEYVGKKIIKISSRLKPIKPQCSAGPVLDNIIV